MPYTESRFAAFRRPTLEVRAGTARIGGNNPILVQSMTTTLTRDVDATVRQTIALAEAGCELVRITTPTAADAACLEPIVAKVRAAGIAVPISADIHFQPAAAFEAVKWADKVRINPGNFVDAKTAYGFSKEMTDAGYERGLQKISDKFRPLVRAARERGVSLRIGTNHGSLSDRILARWGDTAEGMVVSVMEYLAVCEDEGFDQVVFSMKSSNPKVAIQVYRLLVSRLEAGGHKPYPIHLGVTEAGEGRDGRLKSAVGIGALLLDGIGDTIRVSLTEDPVLEIPVAHALVAACARPFAPAPGAAPAAEFPMDPAESALVETLDPFAYVRRPSLPVQIGSIQAGLGQPVRVGAAWAEGLAALPRPAEWTESDTTEAPASLCFGLWPRAAGRPGWSALRVDVAEPASFDPSPLRGELAAGRYVELHLLSLVGVGALLDRLPPSNLWLVSLPGERAGLHGWRRLAAELDRRGLRLPFVLRWNLSGSSDDELRAAAVLGALLCDGYGDLLAFSGCPADASELGSAAPVALAYDLLQAAGARRSKAEFISCPSCGRTLFDLVTTSERIRRKTGHLKDVSIAIMGCIVNGPGEMADADFGYVGGAPGTVNLYVRRDCVRKGIPEAEAPDALVGLIREHGRWVEP